MGRFLGKLSSDAYGVKIDEMKVAHYNIPAAKVVAPDTDGILDGTALPVAAGDVSTFLAQPPYPMNLTMVCSGTQTGKATVYGKNINGDPISEEFTLSSATPVEGVKAFASITKISLPIKAASETIDVGWGGKFGLPYKLAADELVIVNLFNGSSDAGTVAIDATAVEKNTYVPNGTPDGEKALDFYILV